MEAKNLVGAAFIATALSLSFCMAHAAADPSTAAQNEIRAALEKWTTGKTEAVCSLFAADLISSYQGQPEGNYDSLCARLKKSLDDRAAKYHYDLKIEEVLVSADLAVVRLVWTLTVHPQNQSSDLAIKESGLDVFRRQPTEPRRSPATCPTQRLRLLRSRADS
jgi:steroid delta-isomerase